LITRALSIAIIASGLTVTAADPPGAGHFSLTGPRSASSAIRIKSCTVSKPGKGPLAGYTIDVGEDPMVGNVIFQIPSYVQDGIFRSEPADYRQKPRPVVFAAVARLQRSDPFASPVTQGAEGTLIATIRDHGKTGTLEMRNMSWMLEKTYKVSGLMTWTCSSVTPME
jgi:hypothetical protein